MINNVKVRTAKKEFFLIHEGEIIASFNSLQKAHEMRLLYVGIKPMVSQVFDKANLPYKLLSQFHHDVRKLKGTEEFVSILFFQDEKVRDRYLKAKLNLKGDPFFIEYGELFGYPPLATMDFLKRRKELFELRSDEGWSQICFHGLQFICTDDHVQDCIEWLKENYQIPTEYQSGIKVVEAFKKLPQSA